MESINCLVTDVHQNVFFCVQQKKETHTGLEQLVGEKMIAKKYCCGVNYPFK